MTATPTAEVDAAQVAVLTGDAEAVGVATALAGRFAVGARERDRDRAIPRAELEEIRRSGLLGITVPGSHGGAEVSHRALAEIFRLLAVADASISQLLQNHFVFVRVLREAGTREQQEFFFAELLRGARFGNAMAERGVDRRTGQTSTSLRPLEGTSDLLLNGRKYYTTGAATADWVPVKTKDPDGRDVVAYVEQGSPGMSFGGDWSAMGQRGTHSGTTLLVDVRVPGNRIVPWPFDATTPRTSGAAGQLLHAAIDVGLAEAALASAAGFVRTRSRAYPDSPWQRASDEHHLVYEVGRLAVQVRAARALLHSAADAVDTAEADAELDADKAVEASLAVAAARALAAETAVTAASELFSFAGTSATDEELGLDRFWRDARTHTLHDPTRWKYHHIGNHVLSGVPPRGALL
ncbi:SfnB family sulfur acquisition oxidoreductase [Micromonospora sp. NPDC048999]|uniref:SfnB family sulfur acquisition oxidoreductase n=1 Tax=Micromonospora sp. NPDC048999 TaxID=3155391 RepID=UPI0033E9B400